MAMPEALPRMLDAVDGAFEAGDGPAILSGLGQLTATLPDRWSTNGLRRFLQSLNRVVVVLGDSAAFGLVEADKRRLDWTYHGLIERVLIDRHASSRRYQQGSMNRALALGWDAESMGIRKPSPLNHVPLDAEEARVLIAPYLGLLEDRMEAQPYAHFKLCWDAMAGPVAPFDVILDDWLRDTGARGLGLADSHASLQRAFALSELAGERRQRLDWAHCETEIWPLLQHDNMMLAAAAGQFLGMLLAAPEDHVNGPKPPALSEILSRIARLPGARRAAAGGFLNGFAGDGDDPFFVLRGRHDLAGFDLDAWVFEVFADDVPEHYVPSAQAFWFYVHEAYWNAPEFIMALIDRGHVWEAMMCATEAPSLENGMGPVLQRLADQAGGEIARIARDCLARISAET